MRSLGNLALAVFLVGLCTVYVMRRGEDGTDPLRGDAYFYAAMVEGGAYVPPPFRYRIVLPWVARAVPGSAPGALAFLSGLSLVGAYALILDLARHLRIARLPYSDPAEPVLFSADLEAELSLQ